MNRKLVFWTAFNSYQSEKWLRDKPAGTIHPVQTMECPAEWTYFKHGYAYDVPTRRLWGYDTIGSGPFFAHRMDPRQIRWFDRSKRHPTHKAVIEIPGLVELPTGQFCVTLHDANTSSKPEMRYVLRNKPMDPGILKRDFGR